MNEVDDKYLQHCDCKPYNKQLESSEANPRISLIMEKSILLIGQCTGLNFKDGIKPAFPETVTKLQIQQIRINY